MKTPSPVYFQKALEQARKAANKGEVPVGAVIVDSEGQILSLGYNRKEATFNPAGHAEILVIQKAAKLIGDWRLINCDIYVTLEPCLMCLAAIQQARLARLFYGAKDAKGGAISLGFRFHEDKRLNHRFTSEFVDQPRCAQILTEFFRERRKKN